MNVQKLTSGELGSLWTSYMSESLVIPVLKFFSRTCEDEKIRFLLDYSLELSQQNIDTITEIFNKEKMPIPQGFTENDVNLSAPRLYSDNLYLPYLYFFGSACMGSYTTALSVSARSDIVKLFENCLTASMALSRKAKEEMLSKGIFIRPPYIPLPNKIEFVQKQNFLTGWFGNRRPLNTNEITHLYLNIQRNHLGFALLTGFSQVSSSNEVKNYMLRGKGISENHIEVFSSVLRENEIPISLGWDSYVTDSTVSPFSEKLMMFHTSVLNGVGIGNYGIAMGESMRHDLNAHYARLAADIGHYAEDGINILINNEWMEQPPQAVDRNQLAKN
ncbi:hypothetical protein BTR23_18965 [Alkalihalophilus pseudofirmus]|nr:hypothetical protein BTR23_18965 [Alkalihalophilus pseudofirmus]